MEGDLVWVREQPLSISPHFLLGDGGEYKPFRSLLSGKPRVWEIFLFRGKTASSSGFFLKQEGHPRIFSREISTRKVQALVQFSF